MRDVHGLDERQRKLAGVTSEGIKPPRRGVALILTVFALLALSGMIGLTIDGGISYFLKARLSQAVDAATLAGARSLPRGVTLTDAQKASAAAVATNFFNANFPNKFWGCTVAAPQMDFAVDAQYATKYLTITATATAPLYFLRMLGFSTINIGASGRAARRDVNIMMVIDRSSSMQTNGAITPTIAAATAFVNEFVPQRDILGMVVFGGDYYLYPPTLDFGTTSADPLVNEISKIQSSGNTNSATALWVAYNALAQLNQTGALNVIVFFTDGLPNGVTADMIHNVVPSTGAAVDYRKLPSTCGPKNDPVTKAPPANVMVGWFSQTSGFAVTGNVGGLYTTVTNTVADTNDGSQGHVIAAATGCQIATTANNLHNDFKQFPAYDVYGTPTWNDPNIAPYLKNKAYHNVAQTDMNAGLTSPQEVGYMSQNTADFVAQRWRHGDINGIVPLVYGITLTEATGEAPDPVFMLRVTNAFSGPNNAGVIIANRFYDPSKPTGTYINTSQKSELTSAFLQIASQILHLDR
jgi:Flp pilus assembly protein TadG